MTKYAESNFLDFCRNSAQKASLIFSLRCSAKKSMNAPTQMVTCDNSIDQIFKYLKIKLLTFFPVYAPTILDKVPAFIDNWINKFAKNSFEELFQWISEQKSKNNITTVRSFFLISKIFCIGNCFESEEVCTTIYCPVFGESNLVVQIWGTFNSIKYLRYFIIIYGMVAVPMKSIHTKFAAVICYL